jgi:hypothetical protein
LIDGGGILGVVTCGVLTVPTVTDGVVTGGTVTAGTLTVGVLSAGTETVGTLMLGTDTVGTLTVGMDATDDAAGISIAPQATSPAITFRRMRTGPLRSALEPLVRVHHQTSLSAPPHRNGETRT